MKLWERRKRVWQVSGCLGQDPVEVFNVKCHKETFGADGNVLDLDCGYMTIHNYQNA